jgi:hypothetical protein
MPMDCAPLSRRYSRSSTMRPVPVSSMRSSTGPPAAPRAGPRQVRRPSSIRRFRLLQRPGFEQGTPSRKGLTNTCNRVSTRSWAGTTVQHSRFSVPCYCRSAMEIELTRVAQAGDLRTARIDGEDLCGRLAGPVRDHGSAFVSIRGSAIAGRFPRAASRSRAARGELRSDQCSIGFGAIWDWPTARA